jgi:Na+/alanine symporter
MKTFFIVFFRILLFCSVVLGLLAFYFFVLDFEDLEAGFMTIGTLLVVPYIIDHFKHPGKWYRYDIGQNFPPRPPE